MKKSTIISKYISSIYHTYSTKKKDILYPSNPLLKKVSLISPTNVYLTGLMSAIIQEKRKLFPAGRQLSARQQPQISLLLPADLIDKHDTIISSTWHFFLNQRKSVIDEWTLCLPIPMKKMDIQFCWLNKNAKWPMYQLQNFFMVDR